MTIVVLLLLGAVVLRVMTPAERKRLLQRLRVVVRRLQEYGRMEIDRYRGAMGGVAARVRASPAALKRFLPTAIAFAAYNGIYGDLGGAAACAAVVVGACFGVILTRKAESDHPPVRRVALALVTALGIAAAAAIPLRGIADVPPE